MIEKPEFFYAFKDSTVRDEIYKSSRRLFPTTTMRASILTQPCAVESGKMLLTDHKKSGLWLPQTAILSRANVPRQTIER